jgi:hypothetical protein
VLFGRGRCSFTRIIANVFRARCGRAIPSGGQAEQLIIVNVYYFFIKTVFFFSLVRAQVKSDLVKDHYLALAVLYTAATAFLSLTFLVSWQGQDVPDRPLEVWVSQRLGVTNWQAWLGETLILSTVYFKLMARFDEGVIFWTLLLLGMLVVLF